MISVGEKKAVICKGDFHPAELYKGDKKIAGYSVEEFSGENSVMLQNCYNDKVYDAFVHGKNLLDVNKVYPDYANDEGGITYTDKDFGKIYKVVRLENRNYVFRANFEVCIEPWNWVGVYFYYTDGSYDVNRFASNEVENETVTKTGTVTLKSNPNKIVSDFRIGYAKSAVKTEVKLTNMQIEEGSTATEYEPPLTDATITVRGKNLLNISAIQENHSLTVNGVNMSVDSNTQRIKISGTAGANGGRLNYITKITLPAGTYYFSTSVKTNLFALTNIKSTTSITAHNNRSFTLTETTTLGLGFNMIKDTVYDFETWVQIDKGQQTPYEPYIEPQTIPFENGNLTADIPTFRGTTVIEAEATISGKYKKVEEI